ncbi:MAG: hypothetical protein AB1757_20440 [Acidobacteriota bacterium]
MPLILIFGIAMRDDFAGLLIDIKDAPINREAFILMDIGYSALMVVLSRVKRRANIAVCK